MSLLSTLSALAQSVHTYERQLRQAVGLPDAPQAPQSALDACARLEAAAREGEAAVRGRLGAPAEKESSADAEARLRALAQPMPLPPPDFQRCDAAPALAGRLGVPAPNGAAYRLPEEQGPPPVALEKMTAAGAPAGGGLACPACNGTGDSPGAGGTNDCCSRCDGLGVVGLSEEQEEAVLAERTKAAGAAPPAPANGAKKAKGRKR